MVVPQWRGKKKKRTIPLHTKGYHQKCMADSFCECVIVLNDFCTRMVDIKAGGDPRMSFGLVLFFWSLHNFLLQMIQEVSVGKAQLGG